MSETDINNIDNGIETLNTQVAGLNSKVESLEEFLKTIV